MARAREAAEAGPEGEEDAIWAVLNAQDLKTPREIREATRHAARDDGSARERRRDDADPTCLALGWRTASGHDGPVTAALIEAGLTAIPEPPPLPPPRKRGQRRVRRPPRPIPWIADVRDAIDQRIADTDALDRDGQPSALHMIIGVSDRWLRETGSPYDPHNPRVRQLLIQAILWVEHGFGRGSVVAARIDLDEVGAGVVDVIVVPVTDMAIGRPRIVRDDYGGETEIPVEPRPVIAPATYIRRLDEAHGHHRAAKWRGVQDDWHAWCVAHLDPRIQRGIPARVSGRRHLPRDQYAAGDRGTKT